jgi:alpha-galactosidase
MTALSAHFVSCLGMYIFSANIEYFKWDMKRPLTEVCSAAPDLGDAFQEETGHRYMLGVYDLQRRITEAFPHVLLENCASGGKSHDLRANCQQH